MSTAQHTPGPWDYNPTIRDIVIFGIATPGVSRRYAILHSLSENGVFNDAEDDANARLIAAAPDLLAACRNARGALILDHMVAADGEPFGTTTVALEVLDAAIAKAKGTP